MILFFLLTGVIVFGVLMVASYGRLTGLRQNADRAFADLEKLHEPSDGGLDRAGARRVFNHMATEYNAALRQFPAALVAGALGFRERALWDIGGQPVGRTTAERQI